MHEHELETDVGLVRRLLAAQFPHWALLPIEPVESAGTVNALYRLGDDLVVRLPRTARWSVGALDREALWLPRLAPLLPVSIPVPLAKGAPADGYPREWGIYPWLEGENPREGDDALAAGLAAFVEALHGVDLPGVPPASRGSSLARWDEAARRGLAALAGVIDTDAAAAAWDAALAAPEWPGPAVWIHGDLMPANLLVVDGALTGVIDWEISGRGDPACDLMVAWNLLSAAGRARFRAELGIDDATWERGRGWALWTGLAALPYYKETNPVLAENARYRLGQVLGES
jgi:aminoglycoside phosphotransferase (APT) family kinase protein